MNNIKPGYFLFFFLSLSLLHLLIYSMSNFDIQSCITFQNILGYLSFNLFAMLPFHLTTIKRCSGTENTQRWSILFFILKLLYFKTHLKGHLLNSGQVRAVSRPVLHLLPQSGFCNVHRMCLCLVEKKKQKLLKMHEMSQEKMGSLSQQVLP